MMITRIPYTGYGTVEQRENPPPKRKFHTKSIQRIPEQIVGIGGDFHSQDDNDKVKTTLYKVRLSGYDRTGGT